MPPVKTIENPDGSVSSELTITVEAAELNNGKPTLIPTIIDGQKYSTKEAIREAIKSGKKYPSFNTNEEAEIFAKERSRSGGAVTHGFIGKNGIDYKMPADTIPQFDQYRQIASSNNQNRLLPAIAAANATDNILSLISGEKVTKHSDEIDEFYKRAQIDSKIQIDALEKQLDKQFEFLRYTQGEEHLKLAKKREAREDVESKARLKKGDIDIDLAKLEKQIKEAQLKFEPERLRKAKTDADVADIELKYKENTLVSDLALKIENAEERRLMNVQRQRDMINRQASETSIRRTLMVEKDPKKIAALEQAAINMGFERDVYKAPDENTIAEKLKLEPLYNELTLGGTIKLDPIDNKNEIKSLKSIIKNISRSDYSDVRKEASNIIVRHEHGNVENVGNEKNPKAQLKKNKIPQIYTNIIRDARILVPSLVESGELESFIEELFNELPDDMKQNAWLYEKYPTGKIPKRTADMPYGIAGNVKKGYDYFERLPVDTITRSKIRQDLLGQE